MRPRRAAPDVKYRYVGMPSSLPTSIMVVENKSMIKAVAGGEEEEEDVLLMASLTKDLCFSMKREMKATGLWVFSNGKSTSGRSMKWILGWEAVTD